LSVAKNKEGSAIELVQGDPILFLVQGCQDNTPSFHPALLVQGLVNDFRTFNWVQNIKYPQLVYQQSIKLLERYRAYA